MTHKWTRAEENIVQKLYGEGFGFSDLAVRMAQVIGEPVSRNQMAGLCRKLGLRRSAEERCRINRQPKKRLQKRRSHFNFRTRPKSIVTPDIKPAPLTQEQMALISAPDSISMPISQLCRNHCRAITSSTDNETKYCGAEIVRDASINPKNRPYCEFHLRQFRQNVPAIKREKANAR